MEYNPRKCHWESEGATLQEVPDLLRHQDKHSKEIIEALSVLTLQRPQRVTNSTPNRVMKQGQKK